MSAGHASLVGRESGKVIAYGVASSRCIMCERGHSPEDHKCNRNHFGSAKSMKPALAVQMITKNAQLADAKCVVSTLIGDEDSCTIQAVRRESEVPVEKWADMNHVLKSFSSALYAIKVILSLRGKWVSSMTLLGLRFLFFRQMMPFCNISDHALVLFSMQIETIHEDWRRISETYLTMPTEITCPVELGAGITWRKKITSITDWRTGRTWRVWNSRLPWFRY